MSIDKGSNGVPEVDFHRPTTKVNLWIVAGILIFFVVAATAAFWASRRGATPAVMPATATEVK